MDNKLPVAREEKEGWAKLLARISNNVSTAESSIRNKGKKVNTTARGKEVTAVKTPTAASKGSVKTKRTDGVPTRPTGRKRDYKNRQQNRNHEGEDTTTRRTAQQLGIIHPGSYCDEVSTRQNPHYWLTIDRIGIGHLYHCIKCGDCLWLPCTFLESSRLGINMRKMGKTEGYCKVLDYPSNRAAKTMIAKLQDLHRLSGNIGDEVEFAKMTNRIIGDKEYDRHGNVQ